jgi:hypothetical protein
MKYPGFDIQDANTSGQGYSPSHTDTPEHRIIKQWGYHYSHSVSIGALNGFRHLLHCYKRGEHNVSVLLDGGFAPKWITSTSCASGRNHIGRGLDTLRIHLKYKASRYPELKSVL